MPSESYSEANAEFDWSWTDEDDTWVPPAVDPSVFSVARVYDYFLGGKDNFAADRAAAAQILSIIPDFADVARANRDFMVRAVKFLADSGIRQFIDLGTGIPTAPNVHEVARQVAEDSRVVYVDLDPVVTAHSRALLAKSPGVIAIQQDLRQPGAVLTDERVRALIDFSRPVGLLLVAVLHFVGQDVAPEMLAQYRRALPPGSQVVIAVACRDGMDLADVTRLESMYAKSTAPLVLRNGAQVEQLFEGLDVVEPGVVDGVRWRAEGPGCSVRTLAGIGTVRPDRRRGGAGGHAG